MTASYQAPLPWKSVVSITEGKVGIADANGDLILEHVQNASFKKAANNCKLVVNAVNKYEGMLLALKDAAEMLKDASEKEEEWLVNAAARIRTAVEDTEKWE